MVCTVGSLQGGVYVPLQASAVPVAVRPQPSPAAGVHVGPAGLVVQEARAACSGLHVDCQPAVQRETYGGGGAVSLRAGEPTDFNQRETNI